MEEQDNRAEAIALDFPAGDGDDPSSCSWPPRIPKRLRRRLLEECNRSPSTAEGIEARLRDADLRRQQFYEKLSRKARPKQRSPSRSSSQDEDPAHRLKAKLMAAEQKRLSMLADAQSRLAKLDELRQVAKAGLEMRLEKEREKLGTKVETRIRQAELNRMLLLKARKLRRATLKESSSQLLMRRVSRESRCWRSFQKTKRTTVDLAKAYDLLGISWKSVMVMPFEQLAILLESFDTLLTVKALLDRLESRLRASQANNAIKQSSSVDNIDHLLKRAATPRKSNSRIPVRNRDPKSGGPSRVVAKVPVRMSRYPVRIVLCAYMIMGHPDAVLSGQGEREMVLAASAKEFVQELELLIRIILDVPVQSSDEESDTLKPNHCTFRTQLLVFDKAWCAYLNNFVVWKIKDAKVLEDDLVKAACQLELSMIQTCKLTAGEKTGSLTQDMKAIQKQVIEDQKLLKERVHHLSGDAGLEHMESALSNTRLKYSQEKETRSPLGSPITNISSPSSSTCSTDPPAGRIAGGNAEKPNHLVQSLFKKDVSPLPDEFGSLSLNPDSQAASADSLITENEVIVNGILHDTHFSLSDYNDRSHGRDSSIKEKVRETMEKAFWDGVIESMGGEEPQYDRVIQLMKEVRDELSNIAPESWKEEIVEVIDVDILSEVLKSGKLDDSYLARILEFALVTLQKLSSPASEYRLKSSYQQLLRELAEMYTEGSLKNVHAIAMTRGLRFILEEIQALKVEISNARIQLMIPMLKGEAGFDYLRTAFSNRHGPPSHAMRRLPMTREWLSSLKSGIDLEWNEHTSLSSLTSQESTSHGTSPFNLRTGGNFVVNYKTSQSPSGTPSKYTGVKLNECKGERVDLLARIGLLKLVCGVSALTHDTLPETFGLNLNRLRSIQAQMQKIAIIASSILVCRQILLSERVTTSASEMEGILSGCIQSLVELLDNVEDIDIEEIVRVLGSFPRNGDVMDHESHQSRQVIMARMLAKSLQAGDPVFERVSYAIYLAARSVVLGGSTPASKKLAETSLRPIGAVVLTERVVEVAETVGVAAAVSCRVHGAWYKHMIGNSPVNEV
ncbi:hypothetical protein MLD38_023168 [Melastoma candidum]|uniref:Uncharacterized protein n=1 Tax=Melastoma candidum TaxID=119954 RepID=A0ACB9QQ45_9MYRT|nr:hypothetical protein MLD38_023168 [Melastoma candidum]